MTTLFALIKRNIKLFFRDKGMFFTALITPMILLVLYATFLAKVYRDSFLAGLPQGLSMAEELINGCVGGQLISSILAVSCITVAFCSNMLMVQDKANGSLRDFSISPVRASTMAIGYYIATLISTLIICFIAAGICLLYTGKVGFYMSGKDVALLFGDILLLTMFGTALSSVINFFLSTQGQISAVGSIVNSCYGFICGAYMPISQFSEGLQKVLSILPGTHGTSLVRNHCLQGCFAEMEAQHFPKEVVDAMRDVVDCNVYFMDEPVALSSMYLYLGATVAVLIGIYVVLNVIKSKKAK